MNRILLALSGLATLAAALPAAAGAAVIATDHPCYVERQPMTIFGAGWVPGSAYSVETEQLYAFGAADAAGRWTSTTETAPIVTRESIKPKTFTLTGKQAGTPVGTVAFKVVNFGVKIGDASGKPRGRTSWGFSGFEPGKRIYVHVRRGGRTYTQGAGRGDATCGTRRTRLRRLPAVPASRIRTGTYKVFVDNRRAFRKGGRHVAFSIRIYTTFR